MTTTPAAGLADDLKRYIRDVPNFPTTGILFRDITPLLRHGPAFRQAIRALAQPYESRPPDVVVAIESRGLIVGTALAHELGVGIVPIRKAGKLPHKTFQADYTLEYGEATLEIHQDSLASGTRALLVDDLLATGGTMDAAIQLVAQCGAEVIGVACLIELTDLNGRRRITPHSVRVLIQY